MQLVQQYPFSRNNAFNQLFNSLGNHSVASNQASWSPAADVTEHEDNFKVVVDVPGLTAAEIEVTVEKQVLSISGRRESPNTDEEKAPAYARQERRSGEFVRRFTLPDSVDVDAISADVDHGILTVVIPKSSETTLRKISVNG
ncbi:MAG: Hsp20/alpha crystallin family protein [Granulosicoccus sp.]|nr:Hsp20/alpha crystallin family protein [Granulosicoccus sp.]